MRINWPALFVLWLTAALASAALFFHSAALVPFVLAGVATWVGTL